MSGLDAGGSQPMKVYVACVRGRISLVHDMDDSSATMLGLPGKQNTVNVWARVYVVSSAVCGTDYEHPIFLSILR